MGFRAVIALALATAACAPTTASIHGEIAHPVTKDGWPLTVEHFARAPGTVARARPVILCHGVVSNRHFFEAEGNASLPIVLTREGFDVWLVDMRGRSDAGAPGWYFGHHTYSYDIDDFVREDMDALLGYVLAQTGAHDVAWVGHSLGGMIAYARLGTTGEPRIGALVTVGSPGFFAPVSQHLLRFYELSPALAFLPLLPAQPLAALDGMLGLPLAPSLLKDTIFIPESIPDRAYRALEETGVSNASKPELRQFLRGLRSGEFVSRDGRVSYTEGLSTIRTPALVIVGRGDELADPLVGRGVFEQLASTDKELVIAGRGEGFSTDFGHVDLLVGPAARREIHPRIVGWLKEHDGK
ncbi:MAG: alpha/beta fold hydrolase [Polyangiaceae bacterium]